MKKLLPVMLILLGAGGGVGAGLVLRPPPDPVSESDAADPEAIVLDETSDAPPEGVEYVKMSNQFVVPVLNDQRVSALMVLSLSVETTEDQVDTIYKMEPKLRDTFLQVLFDHANIGAFNGAFTEASAMEILRRALRETAQKAIGADVVYDVLITEIARQDY